MQRGQITRQHRANAIQARRDDTVEHFTLHRRHHQAKHAPRHATRGRHGIAGQNLQALREVGTALAKALLAEVVRHANPLKFGQVLLSNLQVTFLGITQHNMEAVAAQMAQAQLIVVTRHLQHAEAVTLEVFALTLVAEVHADPLTANRLRVLEARDAERLLVTTELVAHVAQHVDRRLPALLNPHPNVRAIARWFVGGEFLDDEVIGLHLIETVEEPGLTAPRHGAHRLHARPS